MCVNTHCNASVVHFFGIWITVLTERAPLQTNGITHEWAQFNKGGTGTDLYYLDTKGMFRFFKNVCSPHYKRIQLSFTSYGTAVVIVITDEQGRF